VTDNKRRGRPCVCVCIVLSLFPSSGSYFGRAGSSKNALVAGECIGRAIK